MTLPVSISIFILLVLSIGMHEAAHARVASYFGDHSAEEFGLNTWNPIPHIIHNFWTCLFFPAILWFWLGFFMGGAAVPVDPRNMPASTRRLGYFCAVAAGPTMNLLLAIFFGSCFVGTAVFSKNANPALLTIFMFSAQFNLLLCIFNLIPIPPLDGSSMLATAIPSLRPLIEAMRGGAFLILVILLNVSPRAAEFIFWPARLYSDVIVWLAQLLM